MMTDKKTSVVLSRVMQERRFYSWQHLDWRWRLAHEMVQEPCRSMCQEDPSLERIRKYVATMARCRTSEQRRAVVERFGEIHDAVAIRESQGWQRTFLEARVLSGMDGVEIADRLRLGKEVVVAYERAFFDCRSKLRATDWIVGHAIGAPERFGDPRPLPQAVRHLGYFGGPLVAECVIGVVLKAAGHFGPTQFDEATQFRCRQLLALLVQPLSDKTVAKYMKKHARMLVAESRMRMGGDEPLKRPVDFSHQEWPDELVSLAWNKLADDIQADFVQANSKSRTHAA